MKQLLLLVSVFLLGQCYSQENKVNDDLTGIWITGTGNAISRNLS